MKISIIIVNYNVKYFLEQCLISVEKSLNLLSEKTGFKGEIIVVDNNSVDSSVDLIKTKFQKVSGIFNKQNKGFSAANNQGILMSKGEYLLLLNPDTVVEEDTFFKIIDFADDHPELGGLGVKMIDGSGKFLPESKRGFPSPWTSFYKISGLSKIFPKSSKFGRYHLSYLDQNQIHEVDVLSGAFMLIRKSVLDLTGLLDETFFMYGEDIDLSYRIKLEGYKNFYFPDTKIIHYKGESTKKGSLNYVFLFYKAMIIFAKKHFSRKHASIYSFVINISIFIRAFISLFHRLLKKILIPLFDFILIFGGLMLTKLFWEQVPFGHGHSYPQELIQFIFPLYSFIWIIGQSVSLSYQKPYHVLKIAKGVVYGTIMISILYAFFEESFRFSRALIILGSVSSFFAVLVSRLFINFLSNKNFNLSFSKDIKIAIVGSPEENNRVLDLLKRSNLLFKYAGFISLTSLGKKTDKYLGSIDQIEEIIRFYKINELIFCSKDIASSKIISLMTKIDVKDMVFKIAPPQSLFVIGSHSKNSPGDYYTIDIQLSVSKISNKRNKKIIDLTFSVLFLLFSPVIILIQKHRKKFFSNIFQVIKGKKSMVGYFDQVDVSALPEIKQGILAPLPAKAIKYLNKDEIFEINMAYARDYKPLSDIEIIIKGIRNLGN